MSGPAAGQFAAFFSGGRCVRGKALFCNNRLRFNGMLVQFGAGRRLDEPLDEGRDGRVLNPGNQLTIKRLERRVRRDLGWGEFIGGGVHAGADVYAVSR